MPPVLPGDVSTRGPYVSPRDGLDEIPTSPLKDIAFHQIDPPGRLRLRVSNERHHASLRPEARDDMHVVGEDGDLVHVHLPARCRFMDRGSHGVDVGAPDERLPEPRVPGDMDVYAECSMRHTHLG